MSKKRIVIIDDCRLTCAIASDMLVEVGFDVVTTTSSLEANTYIYGTPKPDLIFLDIEMPMLKGDRKVHLLKERPSSKDIPVVLISAKDEKILAQIVNDCGADGFLQKPLEKDALLEILNKFDLSTPASSADSNPNYL